MILSENLSGLKIIGAVGGKSLDPNCKFLNNKAEFK